MNEIAAAISEVLDRAMAVEDDWDTYGAPKPNDVARDRAALVLAACESSGFKPTGVAPSAEGGIGIIFIPPDGVSGYADVECFNDGEVYAVTNSRRPDESPTVWDVKEIGDRATLERIQRFMSVQSSRC